MWATSEFPGSSWIGSWQSTREVVHDLREPEASTSGNPLRLELLKPDVLPQNTTPPISRHEAMNEYKLGDRNHYRYPRRVGKIIDRPDIMDRMTSLLRQDAGSTWAAVLYGMGGQGKTMLAVHFCRQAQTKHLFLAIFRLDASSEDTLSKGFVKIFELATRHKDQLFDTSDARIRLVHQRIE